MNVCASKFGKFVPIVFRTIIINKGAIRKRPQSANTESLSNFTVASPAFASTMPI